MSAKNVTITVNAAVVATAGYIKWVQGTGTTYTVSVDTQTDYITVTDSSAAATTVATDTLWAAAGDLVYGTANDTAAILSKGTAGQVLQIGASAPSWVNFFTPVTFATKGTVAVATGPARWYNDTGRTLTFNSTRASVGTAPTGASLIVDINKDATTIFTTQGSRPTIAISGFTAQGSAPDVTTIATGSYLTVDIDQVGSTVAGADLTVTIWMTG